MADRNKEDFEGKKRHNRIAVAFRIHRRSIFSMVRDQQSQSYAMPLLQRPLTPNAEVVDTAQIEFVAVTLINNKLSSTLRLTRIECEGKLLFSLFWTTSC